MTEIKAVQQLQAYLKCYELQNAVDAEKQCDKNCDECEWNYAQGTNGEYKEAVSKAISALEKQIGKTVCKGRYCGTTGYACPTCHAHVEIENNYCPKCGQKLRW